jgi:MerR family redox-sensitive transcriptional activator SoxR
MDIDRLLTPGELSERSGVAVSALHFYDLEHRIVQLEKLRDTLTSCIGCDCLSLKSCVLNNEEDHLPEEGSGARLLSVN